MTDAILFYRTTSTFKGSNSSSQYWNPTSLPQAQKLVFTFSDNLLEGINFQYQNNVLDIPAPNSEGIRKINKQENGLKSAVLEIVGSFKIPITNAMPALDADISKLKLMSSMSQIDSIHPYGRIGFYSPNAPEFSIDPNATANNINNSATLGLTISSIKIGYVGQKTTRYSFNVSLSFGGTFDELSTGGV